MYLRRQRALQAHEPWRIRALRSARPSRWARPVDRLEGRRAPRWRIPLHAAPRLQCSGSVCRSPCEISLCHRQLPARALRWRAAAWKRLEIPHSQTSSPRGSAQRLAAAVLLALRATASARFGLSVEELHAALNRTPRGATPLWTRQISKSPRTRQHSPAALNRAPRNAPLL
jgi:hypothetical protein